MSFSKFLVLLLIFIQPISCSRVSIVSPTLTGTTIPPTEKTQPTQRIVTLTTSREPSYIPKPGVKLSSTIDATAKGTPNTCPDPWFEAPELSPSPIFLLIFSGLYAAYRYNLPPDRLLFELNPDPARSFAASFSQSQQLIAYYLPERKPSAAGLWLADVTLCHPILFYSDDDGRIDKSKSYGYFQWGPGDKTVIFRSSENEFPMLIYHLENQKVEHWQGICEDILYLEETSEVVVGCYHDEKYSYLHSDGTITTASNTPKSTDGPVVAWAFSKEGDAAYITSANEVYLLLRSGKKIKLPIEGFSHIGLWDPDSLQWAAEQNRLLVLAYDPQGKRCPAQRACWFVIDGESGEIIWWLKPETIGNVHHWDEIDTAHPAAISSDGELLALQYYQDSLKFLLIVRLATNEVLTNADIFSDRMAWPPP